MLQECDMVALCDLSHQLIHWLPFCCYFERGTSIEWANDAHTDACARTIKRTDKDVCTPTHRPAAQSELQPRCSNLPLSSNIKKKKSRQRDRNNLKALCEFSHFLWYFHSNQASQIISPVCFSYTRMIYCKCTGLFTFPGSDHHNRGTAVWQHRWLFLFGSQIHLLTNLRSNTSDGESRNYVFILSFRNLSPQCSF